MCPAGSTESGGALKPRVGTVLPMPLPPYRRGGRARLSIDNHNTVSFRLWAGTCSTHLVTVFSPYMWSKADSVWRFLPSNCETAGPRQDSWCVGCLTDVGPSCWANYGAASARLGTAASCAAGAIAPSKNAAPAAVKTEKLSGALIPSASVIVNANRVRSAALA